MSTGTLIMRTYRDDNKKMQKENKSKSYYQITHQFNYKSVKKKSLKKKFLWLVPLSAFRFFSTPENSVSFRDYLYPLIRLVLSIRPVGFSITDVAALLFFKSILYSSLLFSNCCWLFYCAFFGIKFKAKIAFLPLQKKCLLIKFCYALRHKKVEK